MKAWIAEFCVKEMGFGDISHYLELLGIVGLLQILPYSF